MNSKKRIATVCNHKQVDKIPIDFWATAEVKENILNYYGIESERELLNKFEVDLRYISGPKYIGPPMEVLADGSRRDIWGVPRIKQKTKTGADYTNVTEPPLSKFDMVQEINNYPYWPSADWFDYSVVLEQCEKHKERATIFSGGRLNRTSQLKAAIYLRGMQQLMEDMYFAPDIFQTILGHIRDFYLEFNKRLFIAAQGKLDIFMMGDDFGMQENLICSKKMWDRFFRPGLKEFISQAKDYDILVMHHSCGAIKSLIPDLIDLGLDILNPIQPEASGMEPKKLKKEYGKDITFHGGISIQKLLPHGTPQQIEEEVKEIFQVLGDGGGFIACTAHNLQTDIPMKNIEALLKAYQTFR